MGYGVGVGDRPQARAVGWGLCICLFHILATLISTSDDTYHRTALDSVEAMANGIQVCILLFHVHSLLCHSDLRCFLTCHDGDRGNENGDCPAVAAAGGCSAFEAC